MLNLDRLGGRTLTVKVDAGNDKTESFDMGGQWVAPSQPDIMEVLKEFEIETYPQWINGTKVMQVGSDHSIRYLNLKLNSKFKFIFTGCSIKGRTLQIFLVSVHFGALLNCSS